MGLSCAGRAAFATSALFIEQDGCCIDGGKFCIEEKTRGIDAGAYCVEEKERGVDAGESFLVEKERGIDAGECFLDAEGFFHEEKSRGMAFIRR